MKHIPSLRHSSCLLIAWLVCYSFIVQEAKGQTKKKNISTAQAPFDYGYGPSDAPIVTVGKQNWISKNLNVVTFANGDKIPEVKTLEEWTKARDNKQPAWCFYKNDPVNGKKFGRLYNWYAVTDPRGLAPMGWHIPNDAEWKTLLDYLGGSGQAAIKLKSKIGWKENTQGDNSSGFSAIPAGFSSWGGSHFLGMNAYWWSSSSLDDDDAWRYAIGSSEPEVIKLKDNKSCLFSVRCIQNNSTGN